MYNLSGKCDSIVTRYLRTLLRTETLLGKLVGSGGMWSFNFGVEKQLDFSKQDSKASKTACKAKKLHVNP